LPFGDCARIVGISRRTLMGWMTKGRRTQEEPLYSFQLAMRGAFAKWKRSLLAAATREALAEGGGKLALEMLARIDAQHFGRKDALRVQPVSPEDDVSWPAPPALGEVIEASVDDGSSGSLPAIVEQHAQAFGDHDARELASALALVSKRNGVQNPPGPDLPGPRITIRRTE
jgi:hypothetical protein